jgi:hypothetical protein
MGIQEIDKNRIKISSPTPQVRAYISSNKASYSCFSLLGENLLWVKQSRLTLVEYKFFELL